MQLPHSIMNSGTACLSGKEGGVAWAREWFLENCCPPAQIVIKEALANGGFDVRSIQKHWFHDCWEVRMRRGTARLAAQSREAARQARRVLAEAGVYVYVDRDAISLDRRGERVTSHLFMTAAKKGFGIE